MRFHTTLQTAPATEPITAAEVKIQTVRPAAETAYDTQIGTWIEAARRACERYTRRKLITQTWKMYMDSFPMNGKLPWFDGVKQTAIGDFISGARGNYIELPFGPAQSFTHLKTYDDSDNATAFDSSNYFTSLTEEKPRIVLRSGSVWPTALRVANAIELQWVTGYGVASAVPDDLRQGMLLHVEAMWNNRGREEIIEDIPPRVKDYYRPYQIMGGL